MEVIVKYREKAPKLVSRCIAGRSPKVGAIMGIIRVTSTLLMVIAVLAMACLVAIGGNLPAPEKWWFLGILVFGILLSYTRRYCLRVIRALQFRQEGYVKASTRYVIEEDGLAGYKRASVTKYGWPDFEEVEKVKDLIILYLDRGYALYMARQDFADVQSFEAFHEALKARIQNKSVV